MKLALFSIRNRLFLLAILVLTGLLVQNTLVSDSLQMIGDLNKEGQIKKSDDNGVIEGLANLEIAVNQFTRNEIELFLLETLFVRDVEIEETRFIISRYELAFDKIEPTIKGRDNTNYKLNVEPIGLYNYIGYNQTLITETENIMDHENGALQIYNEMKDALFSRVSTIDDSASKLRSEYRDASVQYINSSLAIGNSQEGIYGNMTSELDNVQDNLATAGDDAYSYDMLNKFVDLYDTINRLIAAWAYVEVTGFGVNATDPNFIATKRTQFHNVINSVEIDFIFAGQLLNNTDGIRQQEIDSFNKINALFKNELVPRIQLMANQLDRFQQAVNDFQLLLQDHIEHIIAQFNNYLDRIYNVLTAEQIEFILTFDEILKTFSDSVNTTLRRGTLLTVSILVLILVMIIANMMITFRRLNNKFEEVGKGNLSISIEKSYASTEFGKLEKGFDEVVEQLRGALSTIKITSERLSGIAEELAAGSEEASSSIREVSDTMREFSGGASEQNIMLSRVNEKLQDHLTDVERSSVRIGETSNFVLKVAKRTNILGLNASIEAAKAGKFGRGFNVVAEEVRDLSETTKGSANQIAEIIDEVQYSISRAVEDILREVNIVKEVAENTAAGSEEVSAATMEQVTMLSEISETSSELAYLAQELNNAISKFKI